MSDFSAIEAIVSELEECRKICDLMLMWNLKDALDEIKKLSPSSSSSSSFATAPSALQTPFFHYKFGSLRKLNQTISYLMNKFKFRNGIDSQNPSSKEVYQELTETLEYHGFFDLVQDLWIQRKVEERPVESIIDKLISNSVPYVNEIHKILGRINTVPISSRQNMKLAVSQLIINYKSFMIHVEDKDWQYVTKLITDDPLTLKAPYFWDNTDQKSSPLELAFGNDAPFEIVKLIVEVGGCSVLNGAYCLMYKVHPFHRACMNQNAEVVKFLVKTVGTDIIYTSDTSDNGTMNTKTPLQLALQYNPNLDTVRYLINTGGKKLLDLNTMDNNNHPFVKACELKLPVDIIRDLMRVGDKEYIHIKARLHYTPLHLALLSENGLREDVIELLVKNGGKKAVLARTKNDLKTPLHFACTNAPIDTVRLLLENAGESAIHSITSRTIQTPIFMAITKRRFDVADLICEYAQSSPFKVGQDRVESLLGIFAESHKRVLDEYIDCLNYIMEHGSIDQTIPSLFQHFDYGISFFNRQIQRPIITIVKNLGHDRAWEMIMPHIQRCIDNSIAILQQLMRVLYTEKLYIQVPSTNRTRIQRPRAQQRTSIRKKFKGAKVKRDIDLMMMEVLNRFPETIHTMDEDGRLPLHEASEKGFPHNVLITMINIYPDSVLEMDGITGLPFFALLAAGSDSYGIQCEYDLNVIFDMYKKYSGIFQ